MKDFRAKFAPTLRQLERRKLLRGGLSLGGLTLLSGCGDLSDDDNLIDRALWGMLRFNDRVQAALFNPARLAPTFSPSQITRPFRFNAYYPLEKVRTIEASAWQLEVGGLVADKTPWTLQRLRALPQESQITRHICVEGWSQIGQWSGVPLRHFLPPSAPTRAPASSGLNVSTTTAAASTWHPRCTRKPFWHWISKTSRSAPPGARRCACASPPSWALRTRNIFPP